ncbi:MAG: translocation/assembly module TamB domain-containing protein [Pseudomonadota bacterium]
MRGSGALSGEARLAKLTIADETGIWLTVTNAVLDWKRGQLLRGILDVDTFSAQSVELLRLPAKQESLPDPEATGFSLPELPVSIQIETLGIAKLALGAPVVGQAIDLSLSGNAALADSEGRAKLDVKRLDGPLGEVRLGGSFANDTSNLTLDLTLAEGPGGLLATALDLPGAPDLDFALKGEGPLGDFGAELALATEGAPRLEGTVRLEDLADSADPTKLNRAFTAKLGGDLRPLVPAEYHAFLGSDLGLDLSGTQFADETLAIDTLSLQAEALSLQGALRLGADNWPTEIDLSGNITGPLNGDILLSIPGEKTWIKSAEIDLSFDEARGETWALKTDIQGLRREDLSLEGARLNGAGTLSARSQDVTGALDLDLSGIMPSDPALAEAVGQALVGNLAFQWRPGSPLNLTDVDLSGEDVHLSGALTLDGVDGQVELSIDAEARLDAQNLSRFAALAGQDLSGAANVSLKGQIASIAGAFDLEVQGQGTDLAIGEPRIDALFEGKSEVDISAKRDTEGLTLRGLSLGSEALDLKAQGTLSSDSADLTYQARLNDLTDVADGLEGSAQVKGSAQLESETWRILSDLTAPGQTTADLDATLFVPKGLPGDVKAKITVASQDLSPYSQVSGQTLRGALDAVMIASGNVDALSGKVTFDGTGRNLGIGQRDVDALLKGTSKISTQAERSAEGDLTLSTFNLSTPELTASGSGQASATSVTARYQAELRNLGLFVDGLSGPVRSQGTVSGQDGPLTIDATLAGPGSTEAVLRGNIARDASNPRLNIEGSTALGLANRFIAPNLVSGRLDFDLALNGGFDLTSLSGTLQSESARLTVPTARISLDEIASSVRLSGGQADLSFTSQVSSGGQLSVAGQTGLNAPYVGDLTTTLNAVRVTEPGLFETTLDGAITTKGPLTGGAQIAGLINFGKTEIRIPNGGGLSGGTVAGLQHQNEPETVRQTRARAGLENTTQRGGAGPIYGLDLAVRAPSSVFVRGRGLDAEFGGQVRLRGTTQNIASAGQFDLIRGRLDILGKRLVLNQALLQLQGNLDPYISAVATTTASDATVQIGIEGAASNPEVSFTSTPELPEDEVLARLLFGRDLTQISAFQALQLAQAVRVLAGRGGDGIVGKLRQNFSLDDLDVSTNEDGDVGLRAGKYINDNVYTDVTVDSSGKSEVNLNLTLSPTVTLRGSAASDGETGVGIFFERDY